MLGYPFSVRCRREWVTGIPQRAMAGLRFAPFREDHLRQRNAARPVGQCSDESNQASLSGNNGRLNRPYRRAKPLRPAAPPWARGGIQGNGSMRLPFLQGLGIVCALPGVHTNLYRP